MRLAEWLAQNRGFSKLREHRTEWEASRGWRKAGASWATEGSRERRKGFGERESRAPRVNKAAVHPGPLCCSLLLPGQIWVTQGLLRSWSLAAWTI